MKTDLAQWHTLMLFTFPLFMSLTILAWLLQLGFNKAFRPAGILSFGEVLDTTWNAPRHL